MFDPEPDQIRQNYPVVNWVEFLEDSVMSHIVINGGGIGGILMALAMRTLLTKGERITLISNPGNV